VLQLFWSVCQIAEFWLSNIIATNLGTYQVLFQTSQVTRGEHFSKCGAQMKTIIILEVVSLSLARWSQQSMPTLEVIKKSCSNSWKKQLIFVLRNKSVRHWVDVKSS
jgi:hypothetical protein